MIATPHDSHAELAIRALESGRHCVVDKVMALTTADADRMIAARDRSGCMLSVFHNRRWDWDYPDRQRSSRPGHSRAAALDRELGLPPCASTELARSCPIRRDDPARLGCASRRPGASAWPGPMPSLDRMAGPRPVGRRRQRRSWQDGTGVRRNASFRSNRAGFAGWIAPAGGSSAPRQGL